ncbi:hypothetical protein J1605_004294 [Eschrichtius robustus]|uniref:Uncharacterized protein n=1 Tax=Eschrichtius robustus TaxID=9764 RepID=A0AB34HJP8_ESCRO|nr:hypothetical protein J1605_004294 [Eschrichtius robustus]
MLEGCQRVRVLVSISEPGWPLTRLTPCGRCELLICGSSLARGVRDYSRGRGRGPRRGWAASSVMEVWEAASGAIAGAQLRAPGAAALVGSRGPEAAWQRIKVAVGGEPEAAARSPRVQRGHRAGEAAGPSLSVRHLALGRLQGARSPLSRPCDGALAVSGRERDRDRACAPRPLPPLSPDGSGCSRAPELMRFIPDLPCRRRKTEHGCSPHGRPRRASGGLPRGKSQAWASPASRRPPLRGAWSLPPRGPW